MGCICPKNKQKEGLQGFLEDVNADDYSDVNFVQKKNNKTKVNKLDYETIDVNKKFKKKIDLSKYKDIKYDEEFAKNALEKNNYYRELHGVDPLELDEYLGKVASIIAKPILLDQSYDSENLLSYDNNEEIGMSEFRSETELSPEVLMEIWYNEIEQYDFKNPKEQECLEFTNMIWKNSKLFGIGYFHKEDDMVLNVDNNAKEEYIYIALYYPAGSRPGEYRDNILEKKIIINEHEGKEKEEKENEEKENESEGNELQDLNKDEKK